MLRRIWKNLKRWRTIRLGPIAFIFRLDRAVAITGKAPGRGFDAFRRRRGNGVALPLPASGLDTETRDRSPETDEPARELALIVGVGPGFGYALARHLAREGLAVVLASRDARRLDALVSEIRAAGGMAFAYGCDATHEASVEALFSHILAQHGVPNLVVYSMQGFGPGQTVDIEAAAFEHAWRHNCLGAFLVAKESARSMLPRGRGTIVLVGSTSSLLGRAGYLNLAVGKFGQRALAQVMAHELWPQGIHVSHLVIDADIDEGEPRDDGGPQADPDHIADLVLSLHRQSKAAWTSEADVRPWNEQFWEHC